MIELLTLVFMAFWSLFVFINIFAKSFALGFLQVLMGIGVLRTGDDDIILATGWLMAGIGCLSCYVLRKRFGKIV